MRKNSTKNNNILEIKYTDSYYLLSVFSNQKTAQKTTTKSNILLLLKENPSFTIEDIMTNLDKSNGTIKEHISSLKKEGVLKRVGGRKEGHWKVI